LNAPFAMNVQVRLARRLVDVIMALHVYDWVVHYYLYRCVRELSLCVWDGARSWSCVRGRASARWALREVSEVISGVFGRVSAVVCGTFIWRDK